MSEPGDFTPYEPGRDLPAVWPPRAASTGHRLGRAEGVTTRVEGQGSTVSSETILAFRLVDPASSHPLEVELRGSSLAGTVRDGDWVEVAGEPGRSGRLEVARVTNVTTSSEVTAIGSAKSAGAKVVAVVAIIIFVVVLIIALAIGYQVFQGVNDF